MERNKEFDFLKGLLMWGVVWGHVISCLLKNYSSDIWIHIFFRTYDMPMFMLLSGYFLSKSIKKYSLYQLLRNKTTAILFPTLLWSLIESDFQTCFNYYFLYAIFCSSIMVSIIENTIRLKWAKDILYLLIIIGLHLIPYKFGNLPFLFPYFVLGYYGIILKKHFPLFVFLPIFVCCLCFWSPHYNIWNSGAYLLNGNENMIFIIAFRTILTISGMVVFKEISASIYFYLERVSYDKISRFFQSIGKETLAIYILHVIVIRKLLVHVVSFFNSNYSFPMDYHWASFWGYFISPILSLFIIYISLSLTRFSKQNMFTEKLFGFRI